LERAPILGNLLVVMLQIVKLVELGRAVGKNPILTGFAGYELFEVKQKVQILSGFLSTLTTPAHKVALFGMMLTMTTDAQRNQIVVRVITAL